MSGFRHVVMFTFTQEATEEQKKTLVERLTALPAAIPEITSYSIGRDARVNEGNHDFVVVADFADRDGYLVYRDHPAHLKVIEECIMPIRAGRAAVQYDLG
jgi:stress responsive alpha/beta barrel protein